jgi:outer membrane receptor protein involved in Fe transport
MRHALFRLSLAALVAGHGAWAASETPIDLSALSLAELLQVPVVTTAKFAARADDIPSSVSILTAEDIRIFGWRTLADALRSLQGFNITNDHSYAYAGVRGVSVPGDYRPRMQVHIDGLPINESIYSSVVIDSAFPLDLDLVQRIEVVRGPSASVFGGDSMFGVVNVITRSGRAIDAAEAALSLGSGRARQLRATWGGAGAGGNDLVVSVTGFDADGRSAPFPEMAGLGLDPIAHHTGAESGGKLFARMRHGEWHAMLIHAKRDRTVPTGSYGTVFNDPANDEADGYTLAELSNVHPLDDDTSLHSRLYFGRYSYEAHYPYAYDPPDPPYVINRDRAEGRGWGLESRVESTAWAGQRWIAGIEYQQHYQQDQLNEDVGYGCLGVAATPCLEDHRSSRRIGLYVQDEIELRPTTRLTAGLRYDRSSGREAHWSPRLGLVQHSESAGTFKLLYASSFRDPSVYELYYNPAGFAYGNAGLQAESMQSLEGTWERRFASHTRLMATVYAFRLEDMIAADAAGTAQNQPSLTARGVETEYEHRWPNQASLRAGYSLQVPEQAGSRPDNAPRHMLKLNLGLPLGKGWSAGLETQLVSHRLTAMGSADVGGYGVTNLNLGYRPPSRAWDLAFGIYNLFDREYADPVGFDPSMPVPRDRIIQVGRTLQLKLTARF